MTKRFWIGSDSELIVGEDAPAICKSLYRHCEKSDEIYKLYPAFLDHPRFNRSKTYGVVIDYKESEFRVVSEHVALEILLDLA